MNGLLLIGIPEQSVDIIRSISEKTGLSMVDVISESIKDMAIKHLHPKQKENPSETKKPNRK